MPYASTRTLLAAVVATLSSAGLCFAGVDEAKKYIDQAKENVASQAWDDAKTNIELAETELDGVADAEKKPLVDSIAKLKEQMNAAKFAGLKTKLTRDLDRLLDDAKPQIGNNMFTGIAESIDQILGDADNRAALGADLEKYEKQFATFKKLHQKKFAEALLTTAKEEWPKFQADYDEKMKEIANPDTSPNSKNSAIEDLERSLDNWDQQLKRLPAGDEWTKATRKSYDELKKKFTEVALADRIKEKLEALQRGWDTYKDDWDGYAAETEGVKWADYKAQTGNPKIDAFGAPKSKELAERYAYYVQNRAEDEEYQALKDAPAIKSYLDGISKTAEECRARVVKYAGAIVDEAEKDTITNDNKGDFDRLEDSLRVLFVNQDGAQDAGAQVLRARVIKKIQAFVDATEGAEKARQAYYEAMSKSADAKWAEVEKNFSPSSGFDPNDPRAFEGKLIKFQTDNLMGWRFKPGDFPFASTFDGIPIAGKYSGDVRKAIDEIQKKLGRDIGDDDHDGRWTIIAKVTGRTGKLMQKKQAEGDIVEKGTGSKVGTYTVEYADPVDAVIVEIVAAKCGPLCVGEGVGMAKEDGSVGSP